MCSETETLAKLSRLTGASGCVGHFVPVRTAWFLNVLCASALRDVGLCDPMDCSLPGSSVHGVFQARALEWGAVSSSGGSSRPRQGASPCPLCHVSSLPLWSTTTIIVFMILVTSPWCSKYIIKHVERCLLHAEGPKLPRVHQSTLLNSVWACWKGPLWNRAPTLLRSDQRFASGGFVTVHPQRANCRGTHCNSAF